MQTGRIQCLIGTQMVAKGHDFPQVTAVGVLSADSLLHFPDFRAAEKTFQLLAQVAGRAGRGDAPGTVHVQTFHPGHPAIRLAAAHDVEGFAAGELEYRRAFFYPPFCEMASVLVSSPARERAEGAAAELGAAISGGRHPGSGCRAPPRRPSSGSSGVGVSRSSCAPRTDAPCSRPWRRRSRSARRPESRSRST